MALRQERLGTGLCEVQWGRTLAILALTLHTFAQDDLPIFRADAASAFVWAKVGVLLHTPASVLAQVLHQKTTLATRISSSSSEKTVSINGKRGVAVAMASRTTSSSPKGTMFISRTTE